MATREHAGRPREYGDVGRTAPGTRRRSAGRPPRGSVLNVLVGVWLILSPRVVGYTGDDAWWNPMVFGALVAALALARVVAGPRDDWMPVANMAIGLWLVVSAFWLAGSAQASWNVGVAGVIVFALAAWSAAESQRAQQADPRLARERRTSGGEEVTAR